MKSILYLVGMHGLGDNIHQRSIVRNYMREYDEVFIESSWVSVYWDLIEHGLKVVNKDYNLRTQKKNAQREAHLFYKYRPDATALVEHKSIWWRAKDVREQGSVLGAICATLETPLGNGDFRLPIKPEWKNSPVVLSILNKADSRPIMIYRPLVERTEWSGSKARNPDAKTYYELYNSIRDNFYVVSIADLVPGVEWKVDIDAEPDLAFHKGELTFEQLAALFSEATLVYAHPGFSVPLAQAVGTDVVSVFGGYENSRSFSVGAQWAPYLGIDPIYSCQCFMHSHPCDKTIDIPLALAEIREFASDALAAGRKAYA